jgi:hypothetical protein
LPQLAFEICGENLFVFDDQDRARVRHVNCQNVVRLRDSVTQNEVFYITGGFKACEATFCSERS